MPSTVVHLALAGLLAAALLGPSFGRRAVAVVLIATVIPDLDAFAGLVVPGGHRSILHTFLLPLAGAVLLAYDARVADRSRLVDRYGSGAVRVAGVALFAYAVAGIGLDLFTGGANPFYPLHDQFYRIGGKLELSSTNGVVQTFVETDGGAPAPEGLGSSAEVHVSSGVDPSPGAEPERVERVFPIVRSGWQLLLVLTGGLTLALRFRDA